MLDRNLKATTCASKGRLDELLDTIPAKERRKIAGLLKRKRDALASGWAERHQALPKLSEGIKNQVEGGWDSYSRSFAAPLLYVLERGFRTGESYFFHIYADERMRYLHSRFRLGEVQVEFERMLQDDLDAIINELASTDAAEGLERSIVAIITSVHDHLVNPVVKDILRVAFVGDCVFTEIRSFLAPMLLQEGIKIDSHHFYFSATMRAELDTSEIENAITETGFDLIALSFLTFEGLPLYRSLIHEAATGPVSEQEITAKCEAILSLIHRYISKLREKTNNTVLLHGCSGLPLTRTRNFVPFIPAMSRRHSMVALILNKGLVTIANGFENVIFVDEKRLTAAVGLRNASRRLLPRLVTRNTPFHPSAFGMLIAEKYRAIMRSFALLSKAKVIFVDFDNTLWNGVMADGDVIHDVEGQRLLKELKQAGMLLVSLSKNDRKNIRWGEMALEEDDFVLHKISWNTKPQSVLEAAEQLDLDPKSFVLLDDNPVERDLVTSTVRGVVALDPASKETWSYLRMLLAFPATRQTEEAGRRTAMYREAALRREAQSVNVDYGTMMESLDLQVGWSRARLSDLDRLHELVSRTNQFNTTTVRYTASDLANLTRSKEHGVFVATLSDKFGRLGLVGASIVTLRAGELVFDSVVMSCRAMGFGLEKVLVRRAIDEFRDVRRVTGKFIPTERNSPCADLFAQCGFVRQDDGNWTLDVDQGMPEVPTWLRSE